MAQEGSIAEKSALEGASAGDEIIFAGTFVKDNGNFGFIKQDDNEEDMFIMPAQCEALGYRLPPVGSRVLYNVSSDSKTGRPRAENVQLADSLLESALNEAMEAEAVSSETGVPTESGVMLKDNGNFGFIKRDNGEEDMFVLPAQCKAFHGRLPPLGTRVAYQVVVDEKTGRPRAQEVRPELTTSAQTSYYESPDDMHHEAMEALLGETGAMLQDRGNFGFIKRDNGEEDMFVLPAQCQAFNGRLPPLGTRVAYQVVIDEKTGRPRAQEVRPEHTAHRQNSYELPAMDEIMDGVPRETGAMLQDRGNFGFIKRDNGEEDMFVLPAQCEAFYGRLPPLGTRVVYQVVVDAKTGRPRAQDVRPERSTYAQNSYDPSAMDEVPVETGAMLQDRGNFGFIKRDNGEEDMFVMPTNCEAFQGRLPPLGTRVSYQVVIDAKTGRPRAQYVRPEIPVGALRPSSRSPSAHMFRPSSALAGGRIQFYTGTLAKNTVKCGFIRQDNGEPDLFVVPAHCAFFGGMIPPEGTRVAYIVGEDPQKQRPWAESVQAEQVGLPRQPPQHVVRSSAGPILGDGFLSGVVAKDSGKFGFITQDNGEPDLFVLPAQCVGFGGMLPPVGTRIVYQVGVDPQKGRPSAECVQPEAQPFFGARVGPSSHPNVHEMRHPAAGAAQAGTLIKESGKFGFIKQDSGEPDIFVMPIQCGAFGNVLPAIGTRVNYEVGVDPQKGRPNAENVRPESFAHTTAGAICTGTMDKDAGKFGFIKQDSGGEDMFVMPAQCEAFSYMLPALGTRVVYGVTTDPKTGRPRAEDVRPEAQSEGHLWGPAKGKGGANRSQPYARSPSGSEGELY